MKKKRFTEEQIIAVLKEAEAGAKVLELCRKHGISDATFYNWRAKYAGMTVAELRRLRELEAENSKLKPNGAQEKAQAHRSGERLVLPAAQRPNQSWSMDYVADGLIDGRKLRALNIVDDFTRECLAIEVDTSLPGSRVVAVLERLAELRGLPDSITVDHGPEFESRALDAWAYRRAVRLAFIRPGKPVDNCYIESFNGRFRDECLNEHWLTPEEFKHAHASEKSFGSVSVKPKNPVSLTQDSTSIPY